MKINKLKIDTISAESGVWLDWIEGVKLKIARDANKNNLELAKKLIAPYKDILNNGGEVPLEEQDKIYIELLSYTILLDWKGIEDDDGKEIKYCIANSMKLLTEIEDLKNFVDKMSKTANNFRIKGLEKAAKNL